MRILASLVALSLLLAAPFAQARPPPKPDAPLQLIDLTPAFATAWARAQTLPEDERVAAFDSDFAHLLPGFYDPARFDTPAARDRYGPRLLKQLNAFPTQRAGIEDVSRRFSGMFAPALASFEARFGPMTGYPPVYLVHSLGEFDGGTRDLTDGSRLLFGADLIARIHTGDHAIQPFFHHELFHILHARSFKGCGQVWCSLWTEGLAVYVASQLNPSATDEALLLTLPEPIRPAVEKDRAAAVCAVTQRLESTDPADYAGLFTFSRLSPSLPPRFGYYVGYLVAQELGKTRSVGELSKLDNARVRPLVVAALHSLADCGAATSPGPA
ncbi:MAG TPA: hypothetical protein VHN39_08295 [Phenylobacterium sp.]|jgi:hypothetical protein|nr:hypothetical protein [Phenylobacterium sp.]